MSNLQAKQSQFSQLFLIGCMLQPLHQIHSPSLDSLHSSFTINLLIIGQAKGELYVFLAL